MINMIIGLQQHTKQIELCADILHRRFNDRFFKHINDLEGAELSGADTDDDADE